LCAPAFRCHGVRVDAGRAGSTRSTRAVRTVVVVAAVVLASVLVILGTLALFLHFYGDPVPTFTPPAVPVAKTWLARQEPGLGGEVNVRSIRPIVQANSADADVSVVFCILDQPLDPAITRYLGDQPCPAISRLRPGRVMFDYYHRSVAVLVTPRRPGMVVLEGIAIVYTDPVGRIEQTTSGSVLTLKAET
jgi:hypothetical protein